MKIYESCPLGNFAGDPVPQLVIFSETPRNPQPQFAVQSAVNDFVGNRNYYDFVEEWLDNPWDRVVFFGLERLFPYFTPYYGVMKFGFNLKPGDVYRRADLYILKADITIENPIPWIEGAQSRLLKKTPYNAFVLSTLNYPWIKLIITGLNNII